MKWRVRLTALLLMAAGLGSLLRPAAADDPVALEIPDCAGVSGETVRGLVALEVAPRTVLAAGSVQPASTRGVLECEDGVARIRVEESGRTEALQLDISMVEHAAAARPRLLALAMAELIATSRLGRPQPRAAEAETPLQLVAADLQPASAAPDEDRGAVRLPGFQLWLGVAAVREAEPAVLAPSIAFGAVQSWGAFAIAQDVRYDRGKRTEPEVRLGMDVGSVGLGPAWRAYGRSYQLLLGPALRLGYAGLRGTARSADVEGDSVGGFWFGPCAQLALQFRVARRWGVRLGIEVGYVARGVRGLGAQDEALFELAGAWGLGQVGVGFDVVGGE